MAKDAMDHMNNGPDIMISWKVARTALEAMQTIMSEGGPTLDTCTWEQLPQFIEGLSKWMEEADGKGN